MAITVHCDIVSAEAGIFPGLVEAVITHGALDNLDVASGHAPLITNLKSDPIRLVRQGGEQKVYYVSGGSLRIQPNMVRVLANIVVRTGDLDEAATQEILKAAEKALQDRGAEFGYSAAAARLAEAAAQLCIVQQLRKKFGG